LNTAELSAAGFAPIRRSNKRLVANIQSIRKSVGKTRLALTAKKPLGYISVEIGGEEGVADDFIKDGMDENPEIQIVRIRMDDPVYPDPAAYGTDERGIKQYDEAMALAMQNAAAPAMDAFYAAYYFSIKNMRTTVVDTGTDLYALARMADFGRLEKIPQLAYTQVKRAFAKMLDDAYSQPGNCLWLHHMKDRGETVEEKGKKKWQASGVYDMDGCSVVTDKVQAVIELWRDDLTEVNTNGLMVDFHATIVDSRHSSMAMGQKFKNDDITFADIAMTIAGGNRSDWE
jgi:hypothetical protein